MRAAPRLLLIHTLLLLFAVSRVSAEPLVLDDPDTAYPLHDALEYAVDETGNTGPDEISRSTFRPFPDLSVQIPREGRLWLRVHLRNESGARQWIVENGQNAESIVLYRRADRQGDDLEFIEVGRAGDHLAFRDRELHIRYPALRVDVPPGETTELLFCVHDLQSSSVSLTIAETAAYMGRLVTRNLLLGIAFGFFAALVVYNFIVYLFNHDLSYLFYAAYMSAFFMNQFAQERLFAMYVAPGMPYGFTWFIIFGGATGIFGVFFIRNFLETRFRMPILDRLMLLLAVALGVLMAASLLGADAVHADILNILSLGAMVLTVTAMVRRTAEGYLPAIACLAGSLFYFTGTAVEIVSTFVPIQMTWLVRHAQLFGALAQVFILSVALGQKTKLLQDNYVSMQTAFTRSLEQEVQKRTGELEEANRKLGLYAVTDPLTGLYNRGELEHRAREHDTFLQRTSGTRLSVAYLDLDNFKYYNDSFGHPFGDVLLKAIADTLVSTVRGYDVVFRVGGDEFIIMMPDAGEVEARAVAERVRRTLCDHDRIEKMLREQVGVDVRVPEGKRLSCSIGLATCDRETAPSVDFLIRRADSALLRAKQDGKNRIAVAGDLTSDAAGRIGLS